MKALEAALAYAEDGLRVLALEPPIPGDDQSGKRPIAALCPNGVLSASSDPATLRAWWAACPQAGVGLAIPDDWIVVDVDPRNGGGASYDAIAAEHGDAAWPETLEAATGGGGAHLVYKIPPGARFPGKLPGRKGLDIKGRGGYVVAWPSGHYTGGAYEWVRRSEPAELPEWLAVLERGVASVQGDEGAADRPLTSAEEKSLDEFAAALDPHFELGQRNALALAIGGALRNAGLPPSAADYVLDQLPSTAPEKRLADALRAWKVPRASGMQGLRDVLPAWAMAGIEAIDLRPQWQRDAVERALAARAKEAESTASTSRASGIATSENGQAPDAPGAAYDLLGRRIDLAVEPEPLAYLFEGLPLAPGGKVNSIAGAPNAGKSPFAQLLLFSHVTGESVAGVTPLRKGWGLYQDAETGLLAHIRWRRICRAYGKDPAKIEGVDFRDVDAMFSEAYCQALHEYCAERGPNGFVVIDTYGAMLAADIDNNSPQFAHWLRQLGLLSRRLSVVIVVLVHNNKSAKGGGIEGIAGNYQGAGAMQSVVMLERTGEGNDAPILVRCARAPEHTFAPFRLKWQDVKSTPGQDLAKGTGLRADRVPDEDEAPAQLFDQKQRSTVAWSIIDSVTRTPHQAMTTIVKQARGGREAFVRDVFRELVDLGVLLEITTSERVNNHGQVEPVLAYDVAEGQAGAEARLKAGLVR